MVADVELNAITSRIYDNAPKDAVFPYLVFSGERSRDRSTKSHALHETIIEVQAFSRTGKSEVERLLDRVFSLLHSQEMVLNGHNIIAMRCELNEITRENNGVTYRGTIRHKAYIEELAF